jgi:hypothetical protein
MKNPLSLLPLLSLLLLPAVASAQGFNVPVWSDQQPASLAPADPAATMQTDAAGNVYVAATVLNPGSGNADVALIKYGCNGAFQWRRTYDHLAAAHDDRLAGMDLDAAGNAYLALTAGAGSGGADWVILKYDPSGALLWRTNYGSPGLDRAVGLAVDPRGTVAVVGEYDNAAQIRALKLDFLSGALLSPVAMSPESVLPTTAQALTLDGDGNLWVVGTAGSRCLTLRFDSNGRGFNYSGQALSPSAWGDAHGQAIAWSRENDLIFALAGVGGNGTPNRQAVLSYLNVSARTLPLATQWNTGGPIPGTDLKPFANLLVRPTAEDPLTLRVAPGGRVVTLASTATQFGPNWLVASWDPAGKLFAEADSDLGPGGSRAMFEALAPAALGVDAQGRVFVTGTGLDPLAQVADFATVEYSPGLGQEAFNVYDFAGAEDRAKALALDVAGNVYVAGQSHQTSAEWLTTIKLSAPRPRNDACATAQVVGAGAVAFTTWLATDSVPAAGPCGANRKDVWFRWTAPGNGWVELDTFGSCYDTVLAVYTGTCAALTPVPGACNDNATAGRPIGTAQSLVAFMAVAGTTYFIQVGGGGATPAAGDGRLTVFGPLPPLGTCAPGGQPDGGWRKFVVIGTGNSDAGGVWRVTVPNCTDVLGLAPTAQGDSPTALAAKLANSINAACGPSKVRAVPLGRSLLLHIAGCPPDEPVFFRVGPAGTPPDQLCIVPDVRADDVLDPATPPFCIYNPMLMAVQPGPDCNGNTIPDEVDIASGASQDTNANGIPDECEGGLRIRLQGGAALLFWGIPNTYVESASSLTGSWSKLSDTSPVAVSPNDSARYFRLQAQP